MKTDLEVGHEHHVAGGVEVVMDALEEDAAQQGSRLGALVAVPVDHSRAKRVHERMAALVHREVCRDEQGLPHLLLLVGVHFLGIFGHLDCLQAPILVTGCGQLLPFLPVAVGRLTACVSGYICDFF